MKKTKTNEDRAAEMVDLLVNLYMAALTEMKNQTPCPECKQKRWNASLLREAREFLKQHDISLDPRSEELQDLADAADVVPFPGANRAR